MRFGLWLVAGVASFAFGSAAAAQLGDSSFDQFDHPAIGYLARPAREAPRQRPKPFASCTNALAR
jgi:hypothetical protein